MKHIFRIILFIGTIAGMTACVKTDGELEATSSIYYHAADNVVTIDGDGTEGVLHVDADCRWEISVADNWLDVSPKSGSGSMDVSLLANGTNPSSTDERHAELLLKAEDGISKRIQVVQKASTRRILSVTPTTLTFKADASNAQTIAIESNTNWTIANVPTWLTLSQVSGQDDASVSITCENNFETTPRSCTLTIQANAGLSAQVEVTQGAATLPIVAIPIVSDIGETQASIAGEIVESMFAITECGFFIGTTDNPTVDGQKLQVDSPAMSFSTVVTGLNKKQTYYVCAYAVSPVGISYSEVVSLTTLSVPKEEDNNKPE